MKDKLLLTVFLICLLLSSTQAQTLKSSLRYDVQSIDVNQKLSNKINIEVIDLDYQIPIPSKIHTVHGFIEFDAAYLIKFRSLTNNSRYLHTEEISKIISNQLDQTTLELNLKQKYLEVTSNNFNRHILVEVLDIERLKENQVRCHFKANLEFPIQVKAKYQSLDEIQSNIKFKFRTNHNNFFSKTKTSKMKLTLSKSN